MNYGNDDYNTGSDTGSDADTDVDINKPFEFGDKICYIDPLSFVLVDCVIIEISADGTMVTCVPLDSVDSQPVILPISSICHISRKNNIISQLGIIDNLEDKLAPEHHRNNPYAIGKSVIHVGEDYYDTGIIVDCIIRKIEHSADETMATCELLNCHDNPQFIVVPVSSIFPITKRTWFMLNYARLKKSCYDIR